MKFPGSLNYENMKFPGIIGTYTIYIIQWIIISSKPAVLLEQKFACPQMSACQNRILENDK